jgi:phosphatidylserine decarboxylase
MTWSLILAAFCGSVLLWCGLSIQWRFRMLSALGNAVLAAACVLVLTAVTVRLFPNAPLAALVVFEQAALLLVSVAVIALKFYRDPDRKVPQGRGLMVSPADGTVRYVIRIPKGELPHSRKKKAEMPLREFIHFDGFRGMELVQFGIEMNVLNVHVNRSPISGKVVFKKHVKGRFLSLRDRDSLVRNERMVHVIEHGRNRAVVVQIASRLVRRIVSYCEVGEQLDAGQRIGMIKFGSQVDLIVPDRKDLRIRVRPGEAVLAGETVLASFEKLNR